MSFKKRKSYSFTTVLQHCRLQVFTGFYKWLKMAVYRALQHLTT